MQLTKREIIELMAQEIYKKFHPNHPRENALDSYKSAAEAALYALDEADVLFLSEREKPLIGDLVVLPIPDDDSGPGEWTWITDTWDKNSVLHGDEKIIYRSDVLVYHCKKE